MAQPPPGYPTSGMNKPVAPYGYGEDAQVRACVVLCALCVWT
jgi:hypothetical protein